MSNNRNPKNGAKRINGLSNQDQGPSGSSMDRLVWGLTVSLEEKAKRF
jgi:hypothetical protein